MSLMGHKLTNHRGPKSTFVRYGPKADKRGCGWIIRFVPLPEIVSPFRDTAIGIALVSSGGHAMKLPRRRFLFLAAGAAAVPAVSRIARAEAYPTRPVHI